MSKTRRTGLTLVCIFSAICAVGTAVAAPGPCEREIIKAARKYDIPVGILYSVGLTETGRRGSLQPYALNIEGRAHFAATASEAKSEFALARSRGIKLIDLGCMQINHHYHADAFDRLDDMLDPPSNVDYAARFLKSLRRRHGNWSMAVARYHAGPENNPAQKKYICRVISNMVATDFGKWTKKAEKFCK